MEDRLANSMRIASFRIHQSLVEKPLKSLKEYWPLHIDSLHDIEQETFEQWTEEDFQRVKKIHGIN